MSGSILVVEDEVKIADWICKYLTLEGYSYHCARSGPEALSMFEEVNPSLIILDVMLPGMDGIAVCEKIRSHSDVPIIMLTARVDEVDRLIGFAKGADDYVCKPFIPKELMARIKAILRRTASPAKKDVLAHGPVILGISEHSLSVDGQEVQLTQIEFNILRTLMSSPTQVFSREDLLSAAHGKYTESYERTIDFHIKNVRKKVNIAGGTTYIKTVYGVGYKFR